MKFRLPINTENKIVKTIINRYFIIFIGFLVLIIFSDHGIGLSYRVRKQYREMEKRKEFLESEIKRDSINTHRLKTDIKAIEKFGREKYLMKTDNEDVFIIRKSKVEND